MSEARFILSKKILKEQIKKLENLKFKISYSHKTNREVGKVLQEISNIYFSIHRKEEINEIKNKNKIWFFTQAESSEELNYLLKKGIKNFVVDNEIDLENLLKTIEKNSKKINLSLRMKFHEHRVGTGKYFVYGMFSKTINSKISEIKNNPLIEKLGVHLHRKTQNTSEWKIIEELKDSLTEESLNRLDFVNLGGGLPVQYKSYQFADYSYIFERIKEVQRFLQSKKIETWIEPGRFLAGPCIKLEAEIIQIQEKNIIINISIYNCALDTLLTGTKMLIENELGEEEKGEDYLIKGNSPTRDDIFRYKVKLKNPGIGNKIIFLNAGSYNYATDFFGYKKLKTIIVD